MSYARSGGIYLEPSVLSLPPFPPSLPATSIRRSSTVSDSKTSVAASASGVKVSTPTSHKKHTRVTQKLVKASSKKPKAANKKSTSGEIKPANVKSVNGRAKQSKKPQKIVNGHTKQEKPKKKTEAAKKSWHILNGGKNGV